MNKIANLIQSFKFYYDISPSLQNKGLQSAFLSIKGKFQPEICILENEDYV